MLPLTTCCLCHAARRRTAAVARMEENAEAASMRRRARAQADAARQQNQPVEAVAAQKQTKTERRRAAAAAQREGAQQRRALHQRAAAWWAALPEGTSEEDIQALQLQLELQDPALVAAVRSMTLQEERRAKWAAAQMLHRQAAPAQMPHRQAAPALDPLAGEGADRHALEQLGEMFLPVPLPPPGQPLTPEHGPKPPTTQQVLRCAVDFRETMERHKRDVGGKDRQAIVCAVCACFTSVADLGDSDVTITDLPGLALLNVQGEKTAELPRDAKTRLRHDGEEYCLHPHGIANPGAGTPRLRVCHHCLSHLSRKVPVVPPRSLVRVDTGTCPDDMPQPTLLELALVLPVSILLLSWQVAGLA